MADREDLEDRVAALEQLVDKLVAAARCHPVGRAVLRAIGFTEPPRGSS